MLGLLPTGSAAEGVMLYLPPSLVAGFIYFLFEVYMPVNHGLLLARLTLV